MIDHAAGDEPDAIDLPASERGTVAAGCLLTIGSALLTCLMLFINGSLVMAILAAVVRAGPPMLRNTAFMQFVLFSMPVVLTVVQWMMIDYVRTRFFAPNRKFETDRSVPSDQWAN